VTESRACDKPEWVPSDELQSLDGFRAMFAAEFDFVCRSLRRLDVFEADVHDVAQELFMAVHRGLPKYDPARPIRAWLMGYAVRFAANYHRLGWHERRALAPPDPPAQSNRVVEAMAARQLVARCLVALDFDKRVALVMHDLEGISAPDIAIELGVPLNTIYSRVRLAREAFRSAVRALDDAEGARS
jgi:RNA polymerase sigma-70 factor (ECF subfamily)